MNSTLVNALLITVIGMGLVFAAILVLWGLMALIVRLTQETEKPEESEPAVGELAAAEAGLETASPDRERLRRAAAAAVAVAMLSAHQPAPRAIPTPINALSSWQSAGRLSQIKSKQQGGRVR